MVLFDPLRPRSAPYGLTCVRWCPEPMTRPDRHNEIEINLLRSGWLTYLLGGRKVQVPAGRLSVFWAAIPHQVIDYGDTTEYQVATIPLAWLLERRLPDRLVQPLLQGDLICDPQVSPAADIELLSAWETDLKTDSIEKREIVLLEIEARLRRLALAIPETGRANLGPRLSQSGLSGVEKMAGFIAQNYTRRISVDSIGKSVGLHPNYAMSLFKKTFGTTLNDYLTSHRISRAQRLLATTDEKIVDVALSSGFASVSRFNAAFRKTCDCAPREYRQQHRMRLR